MTGLFLATLSVDIHLHDTYFVVAHFHYVMMGSTLVAFLGALHYWWPKFTGRFYPESLGKICSTGVFFGFNLTFLPQFVLGSRGMPRRYWDYDPQFRIFHQLSTIGAYVLGISLFTTVVYLFWSFKNGKLAPRNPWGGSSLEWQAPTPPPLYNFEKPPVLHELYNYDDIEEVSEDVWVRKAPIETEPAHADEIARKETRAAEHTSGATEHEKRRAQVEQHIAEERAEFKKPDPDIVASAPIMPTEPPEDLPKKEEPKVDEAKAAADKKAAEDKAAEDKAAADKLAATLAAKPVEEAKPVETKAEEKAEEVKAEAKKDDDKKDEDKKEDKS